MLNWLAGHRPSDNGFDPDVTAVTEGPETPAPVFAVRAFKHAIFGTPQTQQLPKPRRHSATDSPPPQLYDTKPSRPIMIRPKSWHDAQMLGKEEDMMMPEPMPSPTKGILVTPGTAAARRKTVSFGDQVVDNETKCPPKSGLPDDYPGKYPSPWVKPAGDYPDSGEEEAISKSTGRNKLTEALEQAREDSTRRKGKHGRSSKSQEDAVPTMNSSELYADSARYWKQEYDIYRENTTREVKKLVAKQKAAKNFARDKDIECAELREQLRLEQRKASLLEKRTAELEAQLKEFQEKLQKSHAEEHLAKQEIGHLRRQNSTLGASRPTFAEQIDATKGERSERRTLPRSRSSVLQPSSHVDSTHQRDGNAAHVSKLESGRLPSQDHLDVAKASARPRKTPGNEQEHHGPSTATCSTLSQTGAPSMGRKPVPKQASQPFKRAASDVASQDTRSIALSMGLQPPSPIRESRQDSPLHSPDQPRTNSNDPPIKASEQTLEEPKFSSNEAAFPNNLSSPFIPDAVSEKPTYGGSVMPVIAKVAARVAAMQPVDIKENITPGLKTQDLAFRDENPKPSAAWRGLTAVSTNAGVSSGRRMISKDGQEVGADRIAAARARILARGRQMS